MKFDSFGKEDWLDKAKWVANLSEKKPEYKDQIAPEYYNLVAQYYSATQGPYLLGDKVTYVDFAVYQSIDNDRRTGTLPVCRLWTPVSNTY